MKVTTATSRDELERQFASLAARVDTGEASAGRALAAIYIPFIDHMEDEIGNGAALSAMGKAELIQSTVTVAINMIAKVLTMFVDEGREVEGAHMAGKQIAEKLVELVEYSVRSRQNG